MNAQFLVEGLLVLLVMVGLVTAFSSSFSTADAASVVVPDAVSANRSAPLPPISAAADTAVSYSASGEGTFLPNGDLVGAP